MLTRDQISGPREFKHLRHVGYDQESGLLLDVSNSNQPAVFSVPPAKVSFPSPKRVSPPLPIANISRPAVVSEVIASKLGVPNYSVAPIKHAPSIPTKQLPIIPVRKIPPPPPPRRTVPVEPIIEEGKKVEENFTKPLVDRHLETSKQASKAVDTTVTPRPPAIKTAPPLPVSNIAHPPPVTKPAPQTVKKLSATKAAPPIPFPPSEIGNVATFKPIPPPLDQPLPEPVIDKILVAAKIETVPPPQPVKINTVPAPVPPPRPPQEDNMAPSRSLNSVPPPPAPSMIDTTPITVPPPPQNTVPPPPPQNNMKATAPIPPPPPPPQKKPESVVCPNKVITVTQDKPAAIATSSPSRDILLASIRESGISRLKKISPLTSENGNNNFSSPKKSPPRSAFEEMLLSAVKNSNHQKVKSAVASPNNNSNSASAITSGSGSPKDTSVWT